MDRIHEDAAGAGNHGDGPVPGARPLVMPAIDARPCKTRRGDVDIVSTSRGHEIQIHLSAAQWTEFTAAIRAGKFGHLSQ